MFGLEPAGDGPVRREVERGGDKGAEDGGLRIGAAVAEGMFVVYDVMRADGAREDRAYLAYWQEFETGSVYVFDRVLYR